MYDVCLVILIEHILHRAAITEVLLCHPPNQTYEHDQHTLYRICCCAGFVSADSQCVSFLCVTTTFTVHFPESSFSHI